ncbi:unnamed protein product [Closterium sp. Naga37s-1]|nr:unnamed protein product [Closterium sp. Naga37s-1]
MAVIRAARVGSLLFSSCRATSSYYAHRPNSVRIRTYCRAGSEATGHQPPNPTPKPLPNPVTSQTKDLASARGVANNSARDASPHLPAEPGDTSGRCGSEGPAIQVVFEDEAMIAVNKPPGIMVHSSREATREERAQGAFVKDMVERQLGLDRPLFPAHRIDRPASGVLVFGRTAEACRRVRAAMAHAAAVKEYLVLVRGSPPSAFICDKPLKDDKGVVKPAYSDFKRLLEIPQHRCSLLSVRISTGRRHQIRRHLNHLAFHVIGDTVHGKGRTNAHFRLNHHLSRSCLFPALPRIVLPLPVCYDAPIRL